MPPMPRSPPRATRKMPASEDDRHRQAARHRHRVRGRVLCRVKAVLHCGGGRRRRGAIERRTPESYQLSTMCGDAAVLAPIMHSDAASQSGGWWQGCGAAYRDGTRGWMTSAELTAKRAAETLSFIGDRPNFSPRIARRAGLYCTERSCKKRSGRSHGETRRRHGFAHASVAA